MAHPASKQSPAGFTLLELLMVAAISSLVVGGIAQALHLFGQEVETVRAETDTGPEEAMALMTDMARYGWSVEHPSPDRLDVVNALGERTIFVVTDGDLNVMRPSGATGTLVHGVQNLSVQSDSILRLREDEPLDDYRTWWTAAAASSSGTLALESGLPVGLGFTLASEVPDSDNVVDGVDEHTVFAGLETLVLSLAYLSKIPSDPNFPVAGTGGGKKVEICHVPPGNPENAHTLSVSLSALEAHLEHGDLLGQCEPPADTAISPELTFQLFEARAPDDARPVGPPLASMTVVAQGLPSASASWVLSYTGAMTHMTHDHGPAECAATTADGKVIMCHVPPGNHANAHPIKISPSAVDAHLAHGDYFGSCGAHDKDPGVYTLNLTAVPKEYSFDLSPLGALIEPGRAYTLVMSMAGPGVLYMGASPLVSPSNSGVAQASMAYGDLQPAAVAVPFSLKGMQRITQTEALAPLSSVSLTLELDGGEIVSGSTGVISQSGVPGVWLGTVPGELAEIDS